MIPEDVLLSLEKHWNTFSRPNNWSINRENNRQVESTLKTIFSCGLTSWYWKQMKYEKQDEDCSAASESQASENRTKPSTSKYTTRTYTHKRAHRNKCKCRETDTESQQQPWVEHTHSSLTNPPHRCDGNKTMNKDLIYWSGSSRVHFAVIKSRVQQRQEEMDVFKGQGRCRAMDDQWDIRAVLFILSSYECGKILNIQTVFACLNSKSRVYKRHRAFEGARHHPPALPAAVLLSKNGHQLIGCQSVFLHLKRQIAVAPPCLRPYYKASSPQRVTIWRQRVSTMCP